MIQLSVHRMDQTTATADLGKRALYFIHPDGYIGSPTTSNSSRTREYLKTIQ
jgi:hypothetical protein